MALYENEQEGFEEKVFVSKSYEVASWHIWIYSYNPLPAQKLSLWYLLIWLNASFSATPLLFNSICTKGSPFTNIVTSYLYKNKSRTYVAVNEENSNERIFRISVCV